MIRYKSSRQISLEGFHLPFGGKLSPENRWVKWSEAIPWASPALTVGVVHVVKPNLVTRLEASVADVTGCVSQWGIGSRKVLAESASGQQATPAGAPTAPASTG